MSRNLFLVVTLSLLSASTLLLPTPVRAETPLKFADIQALLRQVRLLPRNQPARPARVNERLLTGDALSTARSSKADLRFNDGSFARVGELALFRFIPNTRQFSLSNGTALLLIPPGRGTTTVKTPNVSAGIRGSALFVRVDEQTGTTIVGALTNSGITVTDNVTNRLVELKAGQMAVADPRGLRLFDFDLNTFYQTSSMVRGLNLEKLSQASSDKDIAAVQGETSEALGKQEKIPDEAIAKNLDFIKLSPQPSGFPEDKAATLLPVELPAVGKPDIFDRGTVGTREQKPANPETSEVGQSGLPKVPPTPGQLPQKEIPTPTEQPQIPKPIDPGVIIVPIERPPAAVKGPEESIIPPATQPPAIPLPGTPPVQVTPAPVLVVPVNPPVQVTPAPVTPPVLVTPAPLNPPIQVAPVPVVAPVTPPVQVTPAPVIAPLNPPIRVTPAPVVAPLNPPIQVTPAPVIAPLNPPIRVTPAPVVAPLNPPIQVAPIPTIAPVTPPIQVAPAPIIAPLNPPVRVAPVPVIAPVTLPVQVAPVPVITPLNPPIQVAPAPVIAPGTPFIQVIPAPVVAPVTPQLLEVAPKALSPIQLVPSPTPNAVPTVPTNPPSSVVSPNPTLAPSLTPAIAPVLPLDGKSTPIQNQTLPSGT